jgi:hypothetical protein
MRTASLLALLVGVMIGCAERPAPPCPDSGCDVAEAPFDTVAAAAAPPSTLVIDSAPSSAPPAAPDPAPAAPVDTTPPRPAAPVTTQRVIVAPTAAPAAPEEEEEPPRSLVFRTTPAGAVVTVRGSDGSERSGTTPWSTALPRDVYTWEVSLAGHVPDRSGSTTLDLIDERPRTVDVVLVPASGISERLYAEGDTEFGRAGGAGCSIAVQRYDAIPRPADLSSEQGARWLGARFRSGLCHQRLTNYERAERAFLDILAHDRNQWQARYQLGRTQCLTRQYQVGLQTMAEVRRGSAVDVAIVAGVRLLGTYGQIACRQAQYAAHDAPERFPEQRIAILALLAEFIPSTEAYLAGAPPVTIASELEPALADAYTIQRTLLEVR